jgi:DNA invertase Pin-like site-specific DNA recombinase
LIAKNIDGLITPVIFTKTNLDNVFREGEIMLVGYCRVSVDDDRQTTDLQRDALLTARIDKRNIYEDRASGAKDNRPGLKSCLDYLTSGDILVVWRLDRLGRSLPHLIKIVTGLKDKGIGFRSLNETIDTTTATGELLFHLFGALAQYERALIRERVIAGLRAAERRGRQGGRPRVLDCEKIEAARELLAGGRTMSAAARTLGIPRSTLVGTLQREGKT